MRILIWLVIALAVVVWVKRFLARATHPEGQSGAPAQPRIETMQQCAHCGIHFPASEAVSGTGGAVYCSTEHRNLGQG
jgi:uncharacterized protein